MKFFFPIAPAGETAIARQKREFNSALLRVRLFYLLLLVPFFDFLSRAPKWLALESIDPKWAVFWVPYLGVPASVALIFSLFFFGLVFSILWPWKRWPRALAFVGYLFAGSFLYSTRSIGHGNHALLWTAFVFVFLPDWKAVGLGMRFVRYKVLTLFWAAQALVLMFYSLAGFWKIYWGIIGLLAGRPNSFSMDALARHLQEKARLTGIVTPIGEFILNHPWTGMPLYLGTIALELLSVYFAFQRPVMRFWGLQLLAMHLSIFFIMGIEFGGASLACLFLFVCSPFTTRLRVSHILR